MAPEAKSFPTVSIDLIVSSKTNPRRVVGDLADLIPSVKARGILEPVKLRPIEGGKKLEIVFGERRVAAARKVGLKEVPAIVANVTDEEVLEEQIIENRDREGVHPLDEAEAYRALLDMKKADGSTRTVEDVAAKCGVDVAKVYRRLALLNLSKSARLAFREGRLEASVAGLIARIKGSALQDRATEELAAPSDGTAGARPYKIALDHVRRTYMLRLAEAPFDVKDGTLLEGVAACSACPKRTGSNRSLFGDIDERDDLCTDAACHAKKTDAAWNRKKAAAEAEGRKVLDVKTCREVFKYGATEPSTESGLVRLDSPCPDDPKGRTYRQIIGAKAPVDVTIGRDEFGTAHDLADRKAIRKVVLEALPAAVRTEVAKADADAEAIEKAARAEEERRDVLVAIVDALAEKATGDLKPGALRMLALAMTETGAKLTKARFAIVEEEDRVRRIARAKGEDLAAVVVCAAIEKFEAGPFIRGEKSDAFDALLAAYGVSVEKVRAGMKAATKAKK